VITLAGLKPRILQLLGDPAGLRYSDAQLAEACRQALTDYDHFAPLILTVVITVSEGGRYLRLTAPPGLLGIRRVVFPFEGEDSPPTDRYFWYWEAGAPCLQFSGPAYPKSGDRLQLTCAVRNRLYGLDDAEETTIPADLDSLLVRGVAGYAMMMRAIALGETVNARPAQNRLLERSSTLIQDYKSQVAAVARSAHIPPSPFAERGWEE